MAYVPEEKKDEVNQEEQQLDTTQVSGINTSGSNITGQQPAQVSATPSPERSGMGQRFFNLRKYIQENKPQIAEKIGEKFGQQQAKVTGDIGKEQQQFAQQFQTPETQRLQKAQQLMGNVFDPGKATQFASDTEGSDQFADYGQTAQDRLNFFKQLREGQYSDPYQINEDKLRQGITGLEQTANLGKTESGRFQLLKNAFGSTPQYTTGQQRLDQLLLQGNPEQMRQLQTMRKGTEPVQQQFEQLRQTVGTGKEQIAQNAADIQRQINQALLGTDQLIVDQYGNVTRKDTGAIAGLEGTLQERLEQAQNMRGERLAEIQEGLRNRQLSADDLALLGLQEGESLYGLDVAPYLQEGEVPTISAISTPEEVARYRALTELAGLREPEAVGMYDLMNLDPTQAGTFDPTLVRGQEALRQAIEGRKSEYQKAVQAQEAEMRSRLGRLGSALETIQGVGWQPSQNETQLNLIDRMFKEGGFNIGGAITPEQQAEMVPYIEAYRKGTITPVQMKRLEDFMAGSADTMLSRRLRDELQGIGTMSPEYYTGQVGELYKYTGSPYGTGYGVNRESEKYQQMLQQEKQNAVKIMADYYQKYGPEAAQRVAEQYGLNDIIRKA